MRFILPRMSAMASIDLWQRTSVMRSYGKLSWVYVGSLLLAFLITCLSRVSAYDLNYGPFRAGTLTDLSLQGKSSKFSPHAQKVGLNHQVQDDDVVSSELFSSLRRMFNAVAFSFCSFHEIVS